VLREFYLEIAALDTFSFPLVSMDLFARLCEEQGVGLFKAIPKPADYALIKPQVKRKRSANRTGSRSKKKRSTTIDSHESHREPIPEELYYEDLRLPVSQILLGTKIPQYVPGELKKGVSDNLIV